MIIEYFLFFLGVRERHGTQEMWRWRDSVVRRAAVPHGQSAIGPSSFPYSSNGGGASFPQPMALKHSPPPPLEHRHLGGALDNARDFEKTKAEHLALFDGAMNESKQMFTQQIRRSIGLAVHRG